MLLAKSLRNGQEKTLLSHTEDVLQTFRALFGRIEMTTRLANCWRRFFRLTDDEWRAFYACSVPAIIFHDLGKANSGFQQAVKKGDRDSQLIRHEHLSALILFEAPFTRWLDSLPDCRSEIVVSAVLGHHLKAIQGKIGANTNANRSIFTFYDQGLEQLITYAKQEFQVDPPSCGDMSLAKSWSYEGANAVTFTRKREELDSRLQQFRRRLRKDESAKRIHTAVRSALIVADSAASGLTRERKDLLQWLEIAFSEDEQINGDYIERNVIQPRIQQIESRGTIFGWHTFQNAAATLPPRALLLSSCGSGKTLAAWRWIQSHVMAHPTARVIFLYPTRATATEGFRDYVSWGPETDVSLIHGTSAWELQGLFKNPDVRSEKDFTSESRLFAIGYWHRRVVSATVDQFLGFMQHSYASMCLLPMLVDSVVVIDEVHSFDKSLFSALRSFLLYFDLPVLCMTASLPERRREELLECGLDAFPQELSAYPDLHDRADMKRYHTCRLDDEKVAETVVRKALEQRQTILWVVNTVDRCQKIASRLGWLCYHSGFTLEDRKKRHDEVISAFQERPGPLLAVTTQVCEMSLDLDANVLITEEAPITSLIQRMGRCNRHAKLASKKIGRVFIYRPENSLPYSGEDLAGVTGFLDAIDGQRVSQIDLQELLEEHGPDQVDPEKYAAFLECGPFAIAREESLRDANDRNVQAVLSSAVGDFLKHRNAHKPLDGYLLPAPRKLAKQDSRLGAFPLVVDSTLYTSELGLLRKLPGMAT